MEESKAGWTLGSLAEAVGGVVDGRADLPVARPVPPDSDDPEGITFAENAKYLRMAEASSVGAVIVGIGQPACRKPGIRVADPRRAFGVVLAIFARPLPLNEGIHSLALVDPEARVDPTASIGPFAVVGRGALVEARARVYPHCYVGEGCTVGADSVLFPGVVLYRDVSLGRRCVLHSGSVLGADGFGFAWDGTRHVKVPQAGGVTIEDDVEVGANATIDRATAGTTAVGEGSKLDNLVHVGHNTRMGKHNVVAGAVAISGSCRIGDRNSMAGQSGVSDHVTIGDDIVIGGQSGVFQDLLEPGAYFGFPPVPYAQELRLLALFKQLPDFAARIRKLEARIAQLEAER